MANKEKIKQLEKAVEDLEQIVFLHGKWLRTLEKSIEKTQIHENKR